MAYKHGFARPGKVERLHNIWRGMIKRCHSPKSSSYARYGGRGITVCEEWRKDYIVFRTWALANGYEEGMTIERKKNNGPYSPANCEWIPIAQQARNRRNSRFMEYKGEIKTLAEWAEIYGVPYGTLVARINVYGLTLEQALTEPLIKAKQYFYQDGFYTIHDLAIKVGIKEATLRYRLKHHSLETAISEKEMRGRWRNKK